MTDTHLVRDPILTRAPASADAHSEPAEPPELARPAEPGDPGEPTHPGGPTDPGGLADSEPALLVTPAGGIPPLVGDEAGVQAVIASLAGGHGPVAVDAERAHGFRYSQRAYLLQFRRAGSGTHLIDPVALDRPDLGRLGDAIADAEWIIHAANQDLPCLVELNLRPRSLFDTELAGRLLNFPRVALGTLLEELFGVRLLKEHSAADWSTRPIPPEWLSYAALDVELLIELRDELARRLVEAGKWEWAQQEFAALVEGADVAAPPRHDPWRRTSGMHKVRGRRQLAYVAALWQSRDAIARRLDRAPGRVLPDQAITDLAASPTPGPATLRQIPGFSRRQAKRFEDEWLAALESAARLREHDLPPLHRPSEGPPQPRMWAAKDPDAASRLARVREALTGIAQAHQVPVENLLTPDHLRRLTWRPPRPLTPESIDATLRSYGARPWQRELVVEALVPLLN